MDEKPGEVPESLLPYDAWMETALRQVVVEALDHAAREGLPGDHHFYITFRTDYPGVSLPKRVAERYPEEMTIVLQHQYDRLAVDRAAGTMSVTLSFGGVNAPLIIPVAAITVFADPYVHYGLRFGVTVPEKPAPAETAAATVATAPTDTGGDVPQVVSLDAFRKRRD